MEPRFWDAMSCYRPSHCLFRLSFEIKQQYIKSCLSLRVSHLWYSLTAPEYSHTLRVFNIIEAPGKYYVVVGLKELSTQTIAHDINKTLWTEKINDGWKKHLGFMTSPKKTHWTPSTSKDNKTYVYNKIFCKAFWKWRKSCSKWSPDYWIQRLE